MHYKQTNLHILKYIKFSCKIYGRCNGAARQSGEVSNELEIEMAMSSYRIVYI